MRNLREQEERGIAPPATIANVAYMYHLAGADDDARRVAGMLEEFAEDYATGPGDWALAALVVGDKAEALQQLRRSAAGPTGGPDVSSISIIARNPFRDPLLDEPEFVDARSQLGEPGQYGNVAER